MTSKGSPAIEAIRWASPKLTLRYFRPELPTGSGQEDRLPPTRSNLPNASTSPRGIARPAAPRIPTGRGSLHRAHLAEVRTGSPTQRRVEPVRVLQFSMTLISSRDVPGETRRCPPHGSRAGHRRIRWQPCPEGQVGCRTDGPSRTHRRPTRRGPPRLNVLSPP